MTSELLYVLGCMTPSPGTASKHLTYSRCVLSQTLLQGCSENVAVCCRGGLAVTELGLRISSKPQNRGPGTRTAVIRFMSEIDTMAPRGKKYLGVTGFIDPQEPWLLHLILLEHVQISAFSTVNAPLLPQNLQLSIWGRLSAVRLFGSVGIRAVNTVMLRHCGYMAWLKLV